MVHKKKTKYDKVILVFFILTIMVTGFIFHNSLQGSESSTSSSTGVTDAVRNLFDKGKTIPYNKLHELVRKAAHVIEFAAFGVCVSGMFFGIYKKTEQKHIGMVLFLCLLVGVCDEFIQSFHSRAALISDVLIDFGGAALGAAITCCAVLIIKKMRKKKIK